MTWASKNFIYLCKTKVNLTEKIRLYLITASLPKNPQDPIPVPHDHPLSVSYISPVLFHARINNETFKAATR